MITDAFLQRQLAADCRSKLYLHQATTNDVSLLAAVKSNPLVWRRDYMAFKSEDLNEQYPFKSGDMNERDAFKSET